MIIVLHTAEHVSNHHDRKLFTKAFDDLDHQLFRCGIQGTGGLVKHQHLVLILQGTHAAVMQHQQRVALVRVLVEMIDAAGV